MSTILIDPNGPHVVTGGRGVFRSHYRAFGVAIWIRDNGTVLVRHRDKRGRTETRKYSRYEFTRPARLQWSEKG